MTMFGIGFVEFVLIALAILLFVKPKDFPKFLRKMGMLYRNLRRTYDETMDYIQQLTELEDDTDVEATQGAKQTSEPQKNHSSETRSARATGTVSRKKARSQAQTLQATQADAIRDRGLQRHDNSTKSPTKEFKQQKIQKSARLKSRVQTKQLRKKHEKKSMPLKKTPKRNAVRVSQKSK